MPGYPMNGEIVSYNTIILPHVSVEHEGWQYQDRASVRLAVQRTYPPQMMPAPMHRMPASPQAFYGHGMNVAYAAIPIQHPPPHMLPQPLPPPAEKRPLNQSEEEVAPRTKKSRKTTKAAEGSNNNSKLHAITTSFQLIGAQLATSRRGYNAKKRSEAAQIAAQNGMLRVFRGYRES